MNADFPGGPDAASLALSREGEVYLSVWPSPGGGPAEQLAAVYRERDRRLSELGVPPERVIWERLFLAAPLPPDAQSVLREVRTRRTGPGPACWVVLEPPCTPGRLCELQVHALRSGGDGGAGARIAAAASRSGADAVLVEDGGRREIHLAGVRGERGGDFAAEALSMFEAAERDLAALGAGFREVARTWIHLSDIGRDYPELNRARREFFFARGIDSPPASTGVGGRPLYLRGGGSGEARVQLSLHAVAGGSLRPMSAPTLNEAPEYGSDFSRGTRLTRAGGDLLHVSGTSAVDERGRSVAAGDFDGQVDRALLNVRALLEAQGSGFPEVVLAVSYLKDRRHLQRYLERAGPLGLLEVPHAIVEAEICRPELLFEVEVMAIR